MSSVAQGPTMWTPSRRPPRSATIFAMPVGLADDDSPAVAGEAVQRRDDVVAALAGLLFGQPGERDLGPRVDAPGHVVVVDGRRVFPEDRLDRDDRLGERRRGRAEASRRRRRRRRPRAGDARRWSSTTTQPPASRRIPAVSSPWSAGERPMLTITLSTTTVAAPSGDSKPTVSSRGPFDAGDPDAGVAADPALLQRALQHVGHVGVGAREEPRAAPRGA